MCEAVVNEDPNAKVHTVTDGCYVTLMYTSVSTCVTNVFTHQDGFTYSNLRTLINSFMVQCNTQLEEVIGMYRKINKSNVCSIRVWDLCQ